MGFFKKLLNKLSLRMQYPSDKKLMEEIREFQKKNNILNHTELLHLSDALNYSVEWVPSSTETTTDNKMTHVIELTQVIVEDPMENNQFMQSRFLRVN